MVSKCNSNIVMAKFLADMVLTQQNTAPIEFKIGTVINGIVHDGYIEITSAPGLALDKIMSFAKKYEVRVCIENGALLLAFDSCAELIQAERLKQQAAVGGLQSAT